VVLPLGVVERRARLPGLLPGAIDILEQATLAGCVTFFGALALVRQRAQLVLETAAWRFRMYCVTSAALPIAAASGTGGTSSQPRHAIPIN